MARMTFEEVKLKSAFEKAIGAKPVIRRVTDINGYKAWGLYHRDNPSEWHLKSSDLRELVGVMHGTHTLTLGNC